MKRLRLGRSIARLFPWHGGGEYGEVMRDEAPTRSSTVRLPEGRLLAVTWGIPDDFGGMTSALLHRSRAFVRLAGREVDVVTFDERPDYPAVRQRLIDAGELIPGIRLHNLHEDVREGRFSGQWPTKWERYAAWLDGLIGDQPAFAIVDSKTTARFMAQYRRPSVVTAHVVHNSHLEGGDRPLGLLRESRRSVFAHLERFDAVVFLTERQRADAAELLSDPGNLAVVPNGVELPAAGPADAADDDRDPTAGVVLASLTPRKRIDHAVDIVAARRDAGTPVSLTIYGDGPEAPALAERVAAAGLEQSISFAGHRRDAAEAFRHASWTLLTSQFEGAPLVLAEAMSRGCLPIAYDIPYGPADLIDDGVDGFLVPDGDRAAAGAAIGRIADLPSDVQRRMRQAARRAATRHEDAAVVAEWARVLADAARWHARPTPPLDASLENVRLRFRRGRILVSANLRGVPQGARVAISLRQPKSGAFVQTRMPARDARLTWRLDAERSRLVGGRNTLVCSIALEAEGARQEFPPVRAFPDARSPIRRAAQRLARVVRTPAGRSSTARPR
ncbi:glycosyltransferase [Agromyces sp. Marseille-P2726]|uniref:glycosyltransferase n=1 Tax=Agromyces sp. Marseille-P2726 TaxID=2709132 RepID=UPI00156F370D|nr:glycosyltransferase [Agromyces sp. Marseille-P2726]